MSLLLINALYIFERKEERKREKIKEKPNENILRASKLTTRQKYTAETFIVQREVERSF